MSENASSPERVLLVAAANLTIGGGERHVADLLGGLHERGFEVAVAAPSGGNLNRLANELKIPYFAVRLDGGISPSALRQLRVVCERWNPDIVHAHGTRAASFARLADPLASSRCVYTLHGIHLDKGTARVLKLPFERYLNKRAARFITTCEADKSRGIALGILLPDKTNVVYNGVAPLDNTDLEVARFEARKMLLDELRTTLPEDLVPESTDNLLLHIGRASVPKDQKTLLRAFASFLEIAGAKDTRLLMVVPPDTSKLLYNDLLNLTLDLMIDSYVHWLEPRDNTQNLYLAADAFILSSVWEGFPYVILEAANASCPIISTAVGGIPEAITGLEEGLLVPSSDETALAEALETLFSLTSDERAKMGALAKKHINTQFTLDAMIDGIIESYRKVLE